jgi:hypothetical protein
MEFKEVEIFVQDFLESWDQAVPRSFVIKELTRSIAEFDDLYRLLAQ